MAKTWENFECTFNTTNTVNKLPDSVYFVTKAQMIRIAFVNIARDLKQTANSTPAVCYLDQSEDLYKAIKAQANDSKITVDSVAGDMIRIQVLDYPAAGQSLTGSAYRIPANGLGTFDFTNNDGVLSHIHIGHEVKNLIAGTPSQQDIDLAKSRLEDAIELYKAGVSPEGIRDMITR